MTKMSSVKLDLFDVAQRDIRALLETDSIPKFRKDPVCIQYYEAKAKQQNDKAKNSKANKKESPSFVSKLWGRKDSQEDKLPPQQQQQQQQQRSRSDTLDALAAWREHSRVRSSSPSGSSTTVVSSNPASISPRSRK